MGKDAFAAHTYRKQEKRHQTHICTHMLIATLADSHMALLPRTSTFNKLSLFVISFHLLPSQSLAFSLSLWPNGKTLSVWTQLNPSEDRQRNVFGCPFFTVCYYSTRNACTHASTHTHLYMYIFECGVSSVSIFVVSILYFSWFLLCLL